MSVARVAPGALPAQGSAFVGRRREIAEVRRLLTSSRLVTLAGPPGVGKTRLALRVAEDVGRRFRDGVWIVELAGLRDPSLLAQEVARALGLHDATTSWAVENLAQHLRERRLLVVLDNCEHLVDACALLVDSLLRSGRGLHVLATSRRSLAIDAEAVFRVPPMSVPDAGSVEAEAVELLARRASSFAGQDLDADDREAAAELCRRLDGIPLAIELAAVRLKTLSIQQVLDRLGDRFAVLGEAERAATPHHRTLRAALDWSYTHATDEEQTLWRCLSVFPGRFDLAAVEAVCAEAGLASDRVLDALDGLVDTSVVSATRDGTQMQYLMLESIRDYGLGKLRESGAEVALRTRHRDHFARLCQEAAAHLTDAGQPEWFDRLERGHHNLRAALDWSLERGEPEIGCAIAANIWLYWEARGHLTEGRRRLARFVEALPADDPVRPRALWVAGYLALGQTDVDAASPLLRESLDLATELGDRASVAFATQYLGLCSLFGGDLHDAAALLERAVQMHREVRQPAAFALSDLAAAVMFGGDLPRAIRHYEDALAMTDEGGDPWTRSHCLWGLALARWLDGDTERASAAAEEALHLSGGLDERTGIALCLELLAWISASRRELERSALLQGAALGVWESIPRQLPGPLREHADRCRQQMERALGRVRFARLVEEGRRLDRRSAVSTALGTEAADDAAPPSARGAADLTPREAEVAQLVARGMTDREIAAELFIAQRTAESHVQHVLTKLGFKSRTQIAAWAARDRLVGP